MRRQYEMNSEISKRGAIDYNNMVVSEAFVMIKRRIGVDITYRKDQIVFNTDVIWNITQTNISYDDCDCNNDCNCDLPELCNKLGAFIAFKNVNIENNGDLIKTNNDYCSENAVNTGKNIYYEPAYVELVLETKNRTDTYVIGAKLTSHSAWRTKNFMYHGDIGCDCDDGCRGLLQRLLKN